MIQTIVRNEVARHLIHVGQPKRSARVDGTMLVQVEVRHLNGGFMDWVCATDAELNANGERESELWKAKAARAAESIQDGLAELCADAERWRLYRSKPWWRRIFS